MISLLLLVLAQSPVVSNQGVGLKDGGWWTFKCTNCSGSAGGGGTLDGGNARDQGLGPDGGRAWLAELIGQPPGEDGGRAWNMAISGTPKVLVDFDGGLVTAVIPGQVTVNLNDAGVVILNPSIPVTGLGQFGVNLLDAGPFFQAVQPTSLPDGGTQAQDSTELANGINLAAIRQLLEALLVEAQQQTLILQTLHSPGN